MGRIIRDLERRLRPSSTFWSGFLRGLAAPTLLYTSSSRGSVQDGAARMIARAWGDVGIHIRDASDHARSGVEGRRD